MRSVAPERRNHVMGPDGDVLTLDNLPPPETSRWVPRRKAQLIAAVRGGLLSFGEVCERYHLTSEEYLAWQDALDRSGLNGLHVTNRRDYRRRPRSSSWSRH